MDGLPYLGGGYPEVYAQALFRQAGIRSAIGLPFGMACPRWRNAEDFLYLQEQLQAEQEVPWPMVEVLPVWAILPVSCGGLGISPSKRSGTACCFARGRRFQPMNFTIGTAPKLERRFWPKNHREKHWRCGYATDTLYAAFPHLHLGRASFVERFVSAAATYRERKQR